MTISLVLVAVMVVLYSVGFTMMLDRGLTRILLGFLLVGNATNLLIFLMSGGFGAAPLMGRGVAPEEMSDPLPQAFVLTAIVITFGVSAFLLALIYRAFRLDSHSTDNVQDDAEDVQLMEQSMRSDSGDEATEEELLNAAGDFEGDDAR